MYLVLRESRDAAPRFTLLFHVFQAELAEQSSIGATEVAQLQAEVDALTDDNQRLMEELAARKGVADADDNSDFNAATGSRGKSVVLLEDEINRLQSQLEQQKRSVSLAEAAAEEERAECHRAQQAADKLQRKLSVSEAALVVRAGVQALLQ